MKPVYCIKMVKAGFFRFLVITFLNRIVCNPREGMVTLQPVTKSECPICDMSVKYTDELCNTGFSPVDGGGNGFSFMLDARTDADIFVGNVSFSGFCTMSADSPCDSAVELFAFITVQDKGFVELSHFAQANISDFRKLLQCQQCFMAHVKSCLVVYAQPFWGVIYGIVMQSVLIHLQTSRQMPGSLNLP